LTSPSSLSSFCERSNSSCKPTGTRIVATFLLGARLLQNCTESFPHASTASLAFGVYRGATQSAGATHEHNNFFLKPDKVLVQAADYHGLHPTHYRHFQDTHRMTLQRACIPSSPNSILPTCKDDGIIGAILHLAAHCIVGRSPFAVQSQSLATRHSFLNIRHDSFPIQSSTKLPSSAHPHGNPSNVFVEAELRCGDPQQCPRRSRN
jgi:hypothetical protein